MNFSLLPLPLAIVAMLARQPKRINDVDEGTAPFTLLGSEIAEERKRISKSCGSGRIYETGIFKGKRALLSLTTGGAEEHYQQDGFNGDMLGLLKPIHRGMLQFVGIEVLAPQIVYGPAHMNDQQRIDELERYRLRLAQITGETPMNVGRY